MMRSLSQLWLERAYMDESQKLAYIVNGNTLSAYTSCDLHSWKVVPRSNVYNLQHIFDPLPEDLISAASETSIVILRLNLHLRNNPCVMQATERESLRSRLHCRMRWSSTAIFEVCMNLLAVGVLVHAVVDALQSCRWRWLCMSIWSSTNWHLQR
jgi:hypothetical protein